MKKRMITAFMVAIITSLTINTSAAAAQPDRQREIEIFNNWLNGITVTQVPTTPANPTNPPNTTIPTAPQAPEWTPTLLTADELRAFEYRVYEMVNEEREKAGIAPLAYREDVAEAARIRARETTQSYTHTRPDGTSFSTIFAECGISKRASGENIYTSPISPEAAMKGWMESQAHKNNILKDSYTATGVGIYQDNNGTLHWVQLFIKER